MLNLNLCLHELELPIPGTATPSKGLGVKRLVFRPYGSERNLIDLAFTEGRHQFPISDLLAGAESFAARVEHDAPLDAEMAVGFLVLVAGVDTAFAGLGLVSLSKRRRRAVV